MTTALSQYFGFRIEPFGANPDPRCLYQSGTHREALASLKYGFSSNRGFTAIIAPPGMGKTALLFRLLGDLRDSCRTVFLFDVDPQCQPMELFAYILRDLGVAPAKSSAEMHEQLKEVLIAEARAERRFLLVIDEAQILSEGVLEMVRLINNFETSHSKLMQVILSGQPQLADVLMRPSMLQLRQRISTFCRIEPLSPSETAEYISYRLRYAGYYDPHLFRTDALDLIASHCHGVPRAINTLCFNALSLCCAMKRRTVDAAMVAEAIADREFAPPAVDLTLVAGNIDSKIGGSQKGPSSRLKRLSMGGVMATMAALLLLGSIRPVALERAASLGSIRPVALDGEGAWSPDPASSRFQVTVQPNQTIASIAKQYLGSFDHNRLRSILDLNPALKDPNHIEAGAKLWLPKPDTQASPSNESSTAPPRNLE